MIDDLPFDPDWPPVVVVEKEPRKCRHPRWLRDRLPEGGWSCGVDGCGHTVTKIAVRRGKNAKARGLALQRQAAHDLGLTNLQGNGAADARSEVTYGNQAFVAQMKSGGLFPGWMVRELDYLPRSGGRTPILVVIETPGVGRKARRLVVVDLADWVDLHGGVSR